MLSNTARRRPSEIFDGALVECESNSLILHRTPKAWPLLSAAVEKPAVYVCFQSMLSKELTLIRRNINNGMSVSCVYESGLLDLEARVSCLQSG